MPLRDLHVSSHIYSAVHFKEVDFHDNHQPSLYQPHAVPRELPKMFSSFHLKQIHSGNSLL